MPMDDPTHSLAITSTLLIEIYPAPDQDIEALARYPKPIRRQLLIDATAATLGTAILELLTAHGSPSYAQITLLPPDHPAMPGGNCA